jgi:hypothetical protein
VTAAPCRLCLQTGYSRPTAPVVPAASVLVRIGGSNECDQRGAAVQNIPGDDLAAEAKLCRDCEMLETVGWHSFPAISNVTSGIASRGSNSLKARKRTSKLRA